MNDPDHSRGAGDLNAPPRKRLLLVEDHASTRLAMKLLLSRQGLEVEVAGSIQEALELAKRQPLHLVISDLGLPDGGGEELVVQLRAAYPHLKAIAVSGRQRGDTSPGFGAEAFDAHLVKPVDFDTLYATIRRLLEGGNGQ